MSGQRFGDVQKGQPEAIQLLNRVAENSRRVAVVHVAERTGRREPHADALRPPGAHDGLRDLQEKARTILDAAAVAIRALVGPVAEKLINEITIRTVNLDAIKTGFLRQARRSCIIFDDPRNLAGLQRARRRIRLLA